MKLVYNSEFKKVEFGYFPETNGTLLIDCTDKEAGISLGNDKFSYYKIKDGQVTGENGIDFSVMAITNVIS